MAAFAFAGVGFYSISPDVFSTKFCCDGSHNREGKILCKCYFALTVIISSFFNPLLEDILMTEYIFQNKATI